MNIREKRLAADDRGIENALGDIAALINKTHPGLDDIILVGIRTRGVHLAERLKSTLYEMSGVKLPSGIMDITLYRDDLTSIGPQPVVNKTVLPFNISGKKIILVDDVFYTGRTMRAALDELMDFGRPALVQIAVLVDRGRHELPIHADYAGFTMETLQSEIVEVRIKEIDDEERIVVSEKSR